MTKRIIVCLTILLLAGASVWVVCGVYSIVCCQPDLSHHMQIDLQLVQQADSGEIVHYEQKYGEVFVSLTDGSVQFISEKTALEVLLRLAIRNDGVTPPLP